MSNLRGWQGAGAITARNNCDSVEVFKTVGSGLDLAHSADFNQDVFHRKDNRAPAVLIGHTRWPTKGAVSLETTHPHVYNGIYGVHNGTIDSIDGKYITKDQSDSALLFEAISREGVDKVIPTVRGAYALVWIDQEIKTLNFLRNDKRPMHFALCNNGTIFWASEAGMLQFVLNRTNTKFELLNLPVDKWHQLDMPLSHQYKGNKIVVTDLKSKAPEVAARAPFLGHGQASGASGTTSGTTISKTATSSPQATPQLAYLRTFWDVATKQSLKETSFDKRENLVWDVNLSRWYKPATQSATVITLSGGANKPRKTYCNATKTWVDIEPRSIPTKTTNPSGTPLTSPLTTEVGQASTESFRDHTSGELSDAASRLVADEAVASSSGVTIDDLFDEADDDGAFKETSTNCWVSPYQFKTYMARGCCWCGDEPASPTFCQWVTADEYICGVCRNDDEYARDYVGQMHGVEVTTVEESLDRKLKAITSMVA